ncbi:hypothetical protein P5G61_09640 [Paenibacillus sp. F6_3S_P_1C]|uniref:Lipoprotein n=1 Tax=Paenibacillus vandeheii TaxID=3035917 RepID=A0ABT8J8Z1_9BACL|nr:hypothetical protein [Paenibacillus vandeheii]MDN4601485.1 hypothetical protein [Paenibacillus vandeheii]
MNKLMFFVLCLTMCTVVTACGGGEKITNNSVAKLSEIEIKANDKEITPTVILISGNKQDYWNMDSFQSILKNSDSVVPYVKIGETISIKFDNQKSAPDSYELVDYVLTEKGEIKYKQPDLTKLTMEFNSGTGSFILPVNELTYASSNSEDYEPGAVLRGFRLLSKWKNTTQEMSFIIKTDAIPK